ncbi:MULTISPECIES: hypothetical protein [unclassified Sinorhizobium]|uniref:hypothetical protein n=1 Tax=unclassified Sinorhizobium TaxID=2613772 RepID=UPI0035246CD7
MKIGDSISSYYGIGGLFGQKSGQSKNQQSMDVDTSIRQSGAGLEPSTTPPSISSTMWALQSAGDTTLGDDDETKSANDALAAELSKWANMTPGEKIRAQYLEEHGLTEESLAEMSPEDREAIEKEIAELIKRQLTGVDDKGGVNTDSQTDIPTA